MATAIKAGAFALQAGQRRPSMTAFVGYLVSAGLINSSIVAILLCKLPESHSPSLTALVGRSLIYVTLACVAGAVGARFYWNRSSTPFSTDPPLSFPLFALANATGWVWVPAVIVLSAQDSPASPALTAIGAAILATGLRKIIPPAAAPLQQPEYAQEWKERELFAETLRTTPHPSHGYVIALSIYAAFYALESNENLAAGTLFALASFLFAWKLTLAPNQVLKSRLLRNRAALRLALVALSAVLVTVFALMFGVAGRDRAAALAAAGDRGKQAGQGDDFEQKSKPATQAAASGISGYESIILWPVPEKKQILPPIPAQSALLAPGTTKPLVLRFNGSYWYFQPPGKRPGPNAHQAQGTPLAIDIQAHNFLPLTMEAHQSLGSSVRLARCREIQVSLLNRDSRAGVISLAVLLTDSASRGMLSIYLGKQPLLTSQPARLALKPDTASEVLSFPVPAHAAIRKFDEITVMIFPGAEHYELGPKIAIQQFELLPR